jgi:hypothetical protein
MHGAKIHVAMYPCQVATSALRRQVLGVSDPGTMPLYLGADDYSDKTRVYFFKTFPQKSYLRESFKKSLKKKNLSKKA